MLTLTITPAHQHRQGLLMFQVHSRPSAQTSPQQLIRRARFQQQHRIQLRHIQNRCTSRHPGHFLDQVMNRCLSQHRAQLEESTEITCLLQYRHYPVAVHLPWLLQGLPDRVRMITQSTVFYRQKKILTTPSSTFLRHHPDQLISISLHRRQDQLISI